MSVKKLFILSALLTLSCAKKTDKETSSVSSGSGIVASAGNLNVVISTAWEDDASNFETHATCSASGTVLAPDNEVCTVSIPEGQLHYSKLKFNLNSSGDCTLMFFRPYYYRKSTSATYTPLGAEDDIDCTSGGEAACWGGAAVELVPSFPDFMGLFTTSSSMEKISSSPNERLEQNGNRHLSNDLVVRNLSLDDTDGIDEGYVANSMRDYLIQCQDKWANTLSSIRVDIIDFDGSNPTTDEIPSWE
jgi:hypothetical protein